MLLWSLADNPYAYYQIQRWVICGISSYFALQYYEKHVSIWLWVFICIAILFNPIAPIYLNREIWSIIDIIIAVILTINIFTSRKLTK